VLDENAAQRSILLQQLIKDELQKILPQSEDESEKTADQVRTSQVHISIDPQTTAIRVAIGKASTLLLHRQGSHLTSQLSLLLSPHNSVKEVLAPCDHILGIPSTCAGSSNRYA